MQCLDYETKFLNVFKTAFQHNFKISCKYFAFWLKVLLPIQKQICEVKEFSKLVLS